MSGSNQAALNPGKKCRKMRPSDGEDLISNLPECLISRILSCLPTKDAVRTSLLSKDWEYKWMSIYNIDIFYNKSNKQVTKSFADSVERVLLHVQGIRSFRFVSLVTCDTTRLASWISAALCRKTETLELRYTNTDVILPRNFINHSSLRNLKLTVPHLTVPTNVCFPNLTSLHFYHISIRNESSNSNYLIFSFPVLKTLELVVCNWLNVKSVDIHAPELTKFKSDKCTTQVDCLIKVIGDKLEEFESFGCLPDVICVAGQQVLNAVLKYTGENGVNDQLYAEKGEHLRVLLSRFSSLRKFELDLTSSMVEAIGKWRVKLPLPRFEKLDWLLLRVPFDRSGLLEILHAAPYLKFLSIEARKEVLWDHNSYKDVKNVPSCVASHLEEVIFAYYGREGPKYNLAKFLLKNGMELKKFHIFHSHDLMRRLIMRRLSALPKVSTSLSISTPYWEKKMGFPY